MNGAENNRMPLACNTGVFSARQQSRHRELVASLHGRVYAVEELPDGYAFRFSSETEVCQDVMEFANLERLCCPFLEFRLEVAPNQETLSLSLTGPPGAKEIVAKFLWCAPL